ncbi:MAG: VIT family protein [Bryobacteraceae bacterium]
MTVSQRERHRTGRVGWLRAAVMGADDGILSTASLLLGVASAHATHRNVMVAGVAGLVAGAMSMAAGEYVSVHSQADTEQADLKRERSELKTDYAGERKELTGIYVARGLAPALAKQVAGQLMAHDALGAHARDELGISAALRARPIQAALASACSFAAGALMPLAVTCLWNFPVVPGASGRVGCARWGRRRDDGRNTRHVLGRSSHGADRGRRGAVRNRRNGDLTACGKRLFQPQMTGETACHTTYNPDSLRSRWDRPPGLSMPFSAAC